MTAKELLAYDRLYYRSYLLRTTDHSEWDKSDKLQNGFDTLEEAELFIEDNIENYDKWTIVTEYTK